MRNHIDSVTEDNDARSDNDAMSFIVETVGIIYRKKKVIYQSSCGL